MGITGAPRTFHKKFLFQVEIDGVGWAGFTSCSELAAEVAEVAHYEGGAVIPDKSPGRVTFPDLTLERGATFDVDLFAWFNTVSELVSGIGLPDPTYKRNLSIVQKNRAGVTVRRWNVFGAWPKKFSAGEWDNDSEEVRIETLELCIHRWELL